MLSSCLPAEFDIWYNESFFIPEDMQVSLKPGSGIRPGMVPISRLVSLVSGTGAGVGTVDEHRVVGSTLCPLSSPQTWQCMSCSWPLPRPARANGQGQVCPAFMEDGTQKTSLAAGVAHSAQVAATGYLENMGLGVVSYPAWGFANPARGCADVPEGPCQGRP